MRSRWILAIVVLAMAVSLPTAVFAQTARVEGMALMGDYIKDYTGIYTYPSEVSNVGNLVYGEFGITNSSFSSPVDRGVGAVLGNLWDGRYGTWAIHLREFTPGLGQGDAISSTTPGQLGFDPNFNASESFDLMWGTKVGTSSIGLRLNRSFFKFEDALPGTPTTIFEFDPSIGGFGDPNLGRNVLGLGGGLGFEMNPNTNIELSFLYQTRTFQSNTTAAGTTTKSEEDKPTSYLLSGRAMWQWQPNVVVMPVVKWYSYDLSNKTTSTTGGVATATMFDNTLKGWEIGASGNWTLGTNDLFVLGLAFAQNKLEQEYDVFGISGSFGVDPLAKVTETISPQVFAALETHVNNWLTLRFGASKGAFEHVEIEDLSTGTATSDEKIDITGASFNMMLGAGVKPGTLQLDAILNDSFPQSLGGLFSNASDYISFPKVTATYAF
jgi:hypothetical protein